MEKKLKYYNERFYLDKYNPEINNIINIIKEENALLYQKELANNKTLISTYKDLISLICTILKELNIPDNELIFAKIIEELIFCGYFSYNNTFKINENEYFKLRSSLALSIIGGSGTCENITSFAHDILKNFFDTDIFVGYLSPFKNKHFSESREANHCINLVNYNDTLYGYDVKNRCVFHFINERQLALTSNFNKGFMTYKPYYEVMYYQKTFNDVLENLKKFSINANKKALTYDEIQDILQIAKTILKKNSDLLTYYSKELEPLKEETNKLLKKIK